MGDKRTAKKRDADDQAESTRAAKRMRHDQALNRREEQDRRREIDLTVDRDTDDDEREALRGKYLYPVALSFVNLCVVHSLNFISEGASVGMRLGQG